jgi:hypothetical protein
VNSPLNSPLYTTFPLFTPLSAIIFPISPHLSPPFFRLLLSAWDEKSPDQWPGLAGVKAYLLEVTAIPTLFKASAEGFTGALRTRCTDTDSAY